MQKITDHILTHITFKASNRNTGWLDRQKFAELIVQECIRAAETTPEMRKSGAADRIREVFGIEK